MDVLETCLPQHLGVRCGGLKRTVTTSIAIAANGLLIGHLIIIIIIFCPLRGIIDSGGGSWRWVDSNRSSREFGADCLLIRCLLLFIGVIKDDDLAVTRQPEDVAVEVTKKFPGKLRVVRSVSDEVFLIRR
jgi:hypothetical protein